MKNQLNAGGQGKAYQRFDRRAALKAAAAAALATAFPSWLPVAAAGEPPKLFWAHLVHLSYNMWGEEYKPLLRFDDKLWDEMLPAMADAGINVVVLDLGDGVQYKSHAEIVVKGAWPLPRLETELARMRKLGLEPIPKFNFSRAHNHWLGSYRQKPFTEKYAAVCRELIAEVCGLFGKPRFFHLGMDEEDVPAWWREVLELAAEVEKHGGRPWIWSDYFWYHRDDFVKHIPKTMLISNWYYGSDFKDKKRVPPFRTLSEAGYDQVPTGSNWDRAGNFPLLVEYCAKLIPTGKLVGFLQTTWRPTLPEWRAQHLAAIAEVKAARRKLLEKK